MAKRRATDREPDMIPVSVLKNELLEYVRHAQRGKSFRITKDGTVVALLTPVSPQVEIAGFAEGVEVAGDIVSPLGLKWNVEKQ